jgi:hypothetical protein
MVARDARLPSGLSHAYVEGLFVCACLGVDSDGRRTKDVIVARKREPHRPRHGVGRRAALLASAQAAALLLATLVVVGLLVAFSDDMRTATLGVAAHLTGGTAHGMAVAAWLVVWLPFAIAGLGLLLFPRLPAPVVVGWLATAALLLLPAIGFLPGRGERVESLVSGPGAAGFAAGLRWCGYGVPLLALVVSAIQLLVKDEHGPGRQRWVNGLALATVSLGSLAVALVIAT